MTLRTLAALAGLGTLIATLIGSAAEPAPPPRLAKAQKTPEKAPPPRLATAQKTTEKAPPPRPTPSLVEGFDVVIYAPHRPIRVSVMAHTLGKPLAERWREALQTAFDTFDRNHDGFLNAHEAGFAISDPALAAFVLNAGNGFAPTSPPAFVTLDADGDGKVTFKEFVAYYKQSAAALVRGFPPVAQDAGESQGTEALFKLFDVNGDGKLTKLEMSQVEKLIASLDADEDECLSLDELLPSRARMNNLRGFAFQPVPTGRAQVPQNVAVYTIGRVPGTTTQQIIKQYDKDGDFELTRAESGFDAETFARLDKDGNGRLTGDELDVWRTGPADLDVQLSIAARPADCRVDITTPPAAMASRGFTQTRDRAARVIVRHNHQALELEASGSRVQNPIVQVKQQYLALFDEAAGKKGYVEEKDVLGQRVVQFQALRVLLDPADFDEDGKLTRAELERYMNLMQTFADLGVGLVSTVRMPTLFQLLDENQDGRLGVRELRTAWDRLIPLEPTLPGGGTPDVITRAAIRPIVSLRLVRAIDRLGVVNQPVVFMNQNRIVVPQKGPAWFRKMDRNGDGDLSRLEFLGTAAEFDAIDTDHDGLISLAEAEAYDKRNRAANDKK